MAYNSYYPRYESRRDDSRDPRLRLNDYDRDQRRVRVYGDTYIPRYETDLDSERSGLKYVLGEQNQSHERKRSLETSPTTRAAKEDSSTAEDPPEIPIRRILTDSHNISDPFVCSLIDDYGDLCEKQFSGVCEKL